MLGQSLQTFLPVEWKRPVLLLWALPLLTWYQFVIRVRNIAEHAVLRDASDPLSNARTTHADPVTAFFFAPYWVNYHLEHHLVMHIPCYRLVEMHRLLLEKGLAFNFSLFALQKFSRGVINRNQEREAFSEAVENFDIRIKDAGMSAGNLSGGNQQKLLLAKVLESEPRVVIIDEPTRGIDIGTKSQIYHFIAELADSGHAVVVISSDIVEIIGLCHRVAIMFHGRLTGIVSGADINEEEIMAYATGLKDQQQSSSDKLTATGVN